MPRVDDNSSDGRYKLPGAYAKVVGIERRRLLEPDPRVVVFNCGDDPVMRAEIVAAHEREARASQAWKRLDAGGPITVAT